VFDAIKFAAGKTNSCTFLPGNGLNITDVGVFVNRKVNFWLTSASSTALRTPPGRSASTCISSPAKAGDPEAR